MDVALVAGNGILVLFVHLIGLGQVEINLGMGVGEIGLKHSGVIRFSAFGKTDEAVTFAHLVADAGAFSLVTLALLIGFLV